MDGDNVESSVDQNNQLHQFDQAAQKLIEALDKMKFSVINYTNSMSNQANEEDS